MRGTHIVLEGIDGAGTTTQRGCLAEALIERGYDVHQTAEPHHFQSVNSSAKHSKKRSSGNQLRWHWPLLWIDWTTFSEKSSQRWPRVKLYCLTATLFRA